MSLNVHVDGLRMMGDHFCIGGFETTRGVLTQKSSRVYFANLASCTLVKGEDTSQSQSGHVVFIRLVHYSHRMTRQIESLRFAEFDTYAGNLSAAQPWVNQINARIKPNVAPHINPAILSSTAMRTLLVIVTRRTEKAFLKHVKPILNDVNVDYRILLTDSDEQMRNFIRRQRLSDWDGILVVEKMRMINHICAALLSRSDRHEACSVPIAWVAPGEPKEPCQLRHCTTTELKRDPIARARLSLALSKPTFVARHVGRVELYTGKHLPLVHRLCFGASSKAVTYARQSHIMTVKQKKMLSQVRDSPVTCRLSFIVDTEHQSTTEPRRIRWRKQRYYEKNPSHNHNHNNSLPRMGNGTTHPHPIPTVTTDIFDTASVHSNDRPTSVDPSAHRPISVEHESTPIVNRPITTPDLFASTLTLAGMSSTASDIPYIDGGKYVDGDKGEGEDGEGTEEGRAALREEAACNTEEEISDNGGDSGNESMVWTETLMTTTVPPIRKPLTSAYRHQWTCVQDSFVAIYVDLLGTPDVNDEEAASIMRLTFVKQRSRNSHLSAEDCIKSVNVRAVRIEPLQAQTGVNACYVDGVNVGLMPVQAVMTAHRLTCFAPFDDDLLVAAPSNLMDETDLPLSEHHNSTLRSNGSMRGSRHNTIDTFEPFDEPLPAMKVEQFSTLPGILRNHNGTSNGANGTTGSGHNDSTGQRHVSISSEATLTAAESTIVAEEGTTTTLHINPNTYPERNDIMSLLPPSGEMASLSPNSGCNHQPHAPVVVTTYGNGQGGTGCDFGSTLTRHRVQILNGAYSDYGSMRRKERITDV